MASYILPNVMYSRFKIFASAYSRYYEGSIDSKKLENLYNLYNLCSKQYLGLGSLLRFIPGTNAYHASQQFSKELEAQFTILRDKFNGEPKDWVKHVHLNFSAFQNLVRAGTVSYINPAMIFYETLARASFEFKSPGISYSLNHKIPLKHLFLGAPIVNIFLKLQEGKIHFRDNIVSNIIANLLNPANIALDTLHFLHLSVNRLLEIGSDYTVSNTSSLLGLTRLLLKGVAGFAFGSVGIALNIIKSLIDIPVKIIIPPVAEGIPHFGESIYDALNHRNTETLVTTVADLQQAKILRRQAKGRDDNSYTAITKNVGYTTEYVGITKADLYANAANPNQLIAIRASKDKIQNVSSLLKIASLFKDQKQENSTEFDEAAVDEAKKILNRPTN
ncbi:hypothetical protein [Legionella jamestowniensis]|uniref:Uncharacterized protein n=1 Tax=Legionella jamestowniensis TaxID=455 RepID=A0A0W0UH92_9GAMM|nr:hypothetical protein [Legionella jamestowniensis]KTD07116.1 hypothetical protein Ljam_1311 [Legionella jamestowniensis]SFL71129.1 hypothetical protein SAMN02746073_1554 [Legionella jamestowniensis DSM 19215]